MKVLIVGGTSIDRKALIEHLSLAEIDIVDVPTIRDFANVEKVNISLEEIMAPYPYGFDCIGQDVITSTAGECNNSNSGTIIIKKRIEEPDNDSEEYHIPVKPKKKRMSRIEKQYRYGVR